jgi:hypothetical protein
VGLELARRTAASAESGSESVTVLRGLVAEIAEDRSALLAIMATLGILRLGVEGKASGWRTLRALVRRDSRLDAGHLDELLARADRQSSVLETLRISIAEQALTRD